MANKKPAKRWKNGVSGNVKGAPPREETLTYLMKQFLKQAPEGQKKTYKELFVQSVVASAIKGNDACRKLVMNYVEGMPAQAFDVTSQGQKIGNYQITMNYYGDQGHQPALPIHAQELSDTNLPSLRQRN